MADTANIADADPVGVYIDCPNCRRELRISRKYDGQRVQCKFCTGQFRFATSSPAIQRRAFFVSCPHCLRELRASDKYLGKRAACKNCGGKIQFRDLTD